jgi:acyl-CoA thioester hydrolase
MEKSFSIRIKVRGYELDQQGHLNQAVYTQYAEHARWEFLQAAGVTPDVLGAAGIGPVLLKATVKFQRELRGGDEVDVGCVISGGQGKLVELTQRFHKPDGVSVARIDCVLGLLDLTTRQLISDPRAKLLELATRPEVLFVPTPEPAG